LSLFFRSFLIFDYYADFQQIKSVI